MTAFPASVAVAAAQVPPNQGPNVVVVPPIPRVFNDSRPLNVGLSLSDEGNPGLPLSDLNSPTSSIPT